MAQETGWLRRIRRKLVLRVLPLFKLATYNSLQRAYAALGEQTDAYRRLSAEHEEVVRLLRLVAPDRDRLAQELATLRQSHEQALTNVESAQRQLTTQAQALLQMQNRQNDMQSALSQVAQERDALRERVSVEDRPIAEHVTMLTQVTSQRDTLQSALAQMTQERNELRERLSFQERQIAEQAANLSQATSQRDTLQSTLAQVVDERAWLREQMGVNDPQITLPGIAIVEANLPNQEAVNRVLDSNGTLGGANEADAFYYALETSLRGSREVIKERQRQYMPLLPFPVDTSLPVVDAGCGRGEFLELLHEHGVRGIGVDLNTINMQHLHSAGLEAYQQDAVQYLSGCDPNSLAAVTAFQMIEHVTQDYLHDFVRTAYAKITPGGFIFLETVNPYCLETFRSFYLDPTHKNPLPPDLLVLTLHFHGFRNTKSFYQNPIVETVSGSQRAAQHTLYQTYGVLGIKPT